MNARGLGEAKEPERLGSHTPLPILDRWRLRKLFPPERGPIRKRPFHFCKFSHQASSCTHSVGSLSGLSQWDSYLTVWFLYLVKACVYRSVRKTDDVAERVRIIMLCIFRGVGEGYARTCRIDRRKSRIFEPGSLIESQEGNPDVPRSVKAGELISSGSLVMPENEGDS